MAPAIVKLTKGAIIECHSVEHALLGQDHTSDELDALQAGSSETGCSTQPQFPSVQVSFPVADGGSHSWIVVPPIVDEMRPTGTGSAPSTAILSLNDMPKYQQAAEKRSGKWPASWPLSSSLCD
jgi:hypothetical protein